MSILTQQLGVKLKKTRPCLIISPNEMNRYISTVIVAPMTTKGRNCPTRISCSFRGKSKQLVLDQIRTVDKRRLVKKLGVISKNAQTKKSQSVARDVCTLTGGI